jgi:glutamine amidotransferase
MIAVVDLKISNLASVLHALRLVGIGEYGLATPENITSAAAVILPGVGAFADGMASLREQGLVEPILLAAAAGTPIFGICLGMQLLASRSSEFGDHAGLGLLPGRVAQLVADRPGYRVPNIGWCDVSPARKGVLFPEAAGGCFYHVHSFHLVPDDSDAIAATTDFSGRDIAVAVETGNLFGVQFHAEKSQDDGLAVLSRFLRFVNDRKQGGA